MKEDVMIIDRVLDVAKATCLSFEDLPKDAVKLQDVADIKEPERIQIVNRYTKHGFAILRLSKKDSNSRGLTVLARSLNLGKPFVPPLYGHANSPEVAISRITVYPGGGHSHPSFGGTNAVKLHCDGTLQEIGFVKTSILLCENHAVEGGETTLFNAAAAFSELTSIDTRAAAALASPGVLIRQANLYDCHDFHSGPGFSVGDGQLICCYSVSDTDRWESTSGVNAADLQRGLEFLSEAAKPGSRFFTELKLLAGHAIVLSNTKISHGRKSYYDNDASIRCLYRGLFLKELAVETRSGVGLSGDDIDYE